MTGQASYHLSVMLASLAGAAGFVLAMQAWTKFRGSPFGRALSIIPVFMGIVAIYHPILLLFPDAVDVALLVESLGFWLLVLFVGMMIRLHWQMSPRKE